MFLLLRMAFWLGIVLILLSGGTAHRVAASKLGAADAVSAASATVHDLERFCTREPIACTVGWQFATAMGRGARVGARMLHDFLSETLAPGGTGSLDGGADHRSSRPFAHSSLEDTLTPADLAPAWRGTPVRETGKRSA